jgi:quercetin dioxygenase-like cupin family protein
MDITRLRKRSSPPPATLTLPPAAAIDGTAARPENAGGPCHDTTYQYLEGTDLKIAHPPRRAWLVVLLALPLLIAGLAGVAAQDATPAPATPASGAVVRDVLAEATPAAAPEDALQLVQYTIPPHIQLPAHTHPGMQVSTVVSGTLLYTVVAGEARVTRADGTVETITPERGEVAIEAGDALVEPAGMVHFGRNGGDEEIVLLTASLLEADEPPSHLAATPAA